MVYHAIEDVNNRIVDENYEISAVEARGKLWDFSHAKRIMSALSTLSIGNQNATDFRTMLLTALKHREMAHPAEYPSSQQFAFVNTEESFANIYDNIILPT